MFKPPFWLMSRLLHEDEETLCYYHRYTQGDTTALSWIYQQVHPPLTKLGSRWLNDPFAVQTCVQDTLLKGWQFRQRMQSPAHLYRFMRLGLRWFCLRYYRQPSYRFHRHLLRLEEPGYTTYSTAEENTHHFDEERYQLVVNALPYLPGNSGTILRLYFQYGISYKKIARRFCSSPQKINFEAQQGVAVLKCIINAYKKLQIPAAKEQECLPASASSTDSERELIFRYRYEGKMSFAHIAHKMNLPQAYVQQQYVTAHRHLRTLQRK